MDYLVSIILNRQRNWADYKTFGVLAGEPGGGGGDDGLGVLRKGDRVYACIWPKGYVAVGAVVGEARPAADFFGPGDFVPPGGSRHWEAIPAARIPFLREGEGTLVVPVRWGRHYPKNKAPKQAGMQHPAGAAVAPLTDEATRSFLRRKFDR